MTRAMTKYVRDLRSLALVAVAAAACGTKYVADLDTEAQQGSGDGEGGSTDATAKTETKNHWARDIAGGSSTGARRYGAATLAMMKS